jgi:hypothetical protein
MLSSQAHVEAHCRCVCSTRTRHWKTVSAWINWRRGARCLSVTIIIRATASLFVRRNFPTTSNVTQRTDSVLSMFCAGFALYRGAPHLAGRQCLVSAQTSDNTHTHTYTHAQTHTHTLIHRHAHTLAFPNLLPFALQGWSQGATDA